MGRIQFPGTNYIWYSFISHILVSLTWIWSRTLYRSTRFVLVLNFVTFICCLHVTNKVVRSSVLISIGNEAAESEACEHRGRLHLSRPLCLGFRIGSTSQSLQEILLLLVWINKCKLNFPNSSSQDPEVDLVLIFLSNFCRLWRLISIEGWLQNILLGFQCNCLILINCQCNCWLYFKFCISISS